MKLKKIELQGFKSFAQKTEFVFDAGVTCIVGPNGCGKSNIIDSINWVLGTLSSKLVRSDEMLDVIFKGTETIPPVQFAQVSLTIDNSSHMIPVPYEEVTVTRKIYKSGECEYFINKQLCRLKDIKEMFYGTGLGADNYGIIEQGKVEQLVLASPRERRFLFDEVAGISKYKAKRKEAIARLEKVNADLLRMQDVLKEIESQLHSIRIQAGRARKYVEIQEELKAKRSIHFCQEYKNLLNELVAANEAVVQSRAQRAQLEGKRDRARAVLTEREAKLADLVTRLNELDLRIAEATQNVAHLQESRRKAEDYIRDLESQKAERSREKIELQRKIKSLEEGAAAGAQELEKFVRRLSAIETKLKDAASALEEAAFECQNLTDQIEEKKAQAYEMARKESTYRTEMTQIEASLQVLTRDLERTNKTLAKVQMELAETQLQLKSKEIQKADLANHIQNALERKNTLEGDRQRYENELAELERRLAERRKERDTKMARKEALQELENKMAGIEAGSRALLQAHEGALGIVADFIEVEPRYLAAVDVILQDLQASVVTRDFQSAVDALNYVKSRELGSVSLVAITDGSEPPALHPELKVNGVLGRATEFIEIKDPALEKALARYLGRYIVVETAEQAAALVRSGLTQDPVVTLDGTLFEGNVIKMKKSPFYEQSVLSRRVVLRELGGEIKAAIDQIFELEKRRDQLKQDLQYVTTELEGARHAVYEKEVELREITADIESLAQKQAVLKKEAETQQLEHAQLNSQMENSLQRKLKLEELINELAGLKQKLGEEIQQLSATQKQYEKNKEKLQHRLRNLQIGQAHERQKCENIRAGLARNEAALKEAREALLKVDGYLRQLDERAAQFHAEIEQSAAREQELQKIREERLQEADRLKSVQAGLQKEFDAADAELRAAEKELEASGEEVHRQEMKAGEARLNLEHLEQRAREEIGLDLRAAAATYVEDPDLDYAALTEEVEKLKKRLAGFGAVNMLALEKLKELEERDAFLRQQQKDLEQSKRELEEFIARVNLESGELFKKTIETVRTHFNDIFRKIFGGGKADVVVESEPDVDPLEQGIEVMAKLPKKEVTKLSLMSGGEKSLTAIALTLAMFRTKPTAFCILDEVDAALDEANVDKFASLIKEFSKETQFIIISHNKRTMMIADKMYGITMSPPGVSKRVSVNFEGRIVKEEETAKSEDPAAPPA